MRSMDPLPRGDRVDRLVVAPVGLDCSATDRRLRRTVLRPGGRSRNRGITAGLRGSDSDDARLPFRARTSLPGHGNTSHRQRSRSSPSDRTAFARDHVGRRTKPARRVEPLLSGRVVVTAAAASRPGLQSRRRSRQRRHGRETLERKGSRYDLSARSAPQTGDVVGQQAQDIVLVVGGSTGDAGRSKCHGCDAIARVTARRRIADQIGVPEVREDGISVPG